MSARGMFAVCKGWHEAAGDPSTVLAMTDVGAAEGRIVGRYDILREVGRGGMAVVYLARQADLDRDVALKELAAFRAADPQSLERFLLESKLAGSLNHPNVVTVHDYFEHEGTPYIAMEYFERGSLRRFVGSLMLPKTAGVLEGLLAGLAHAESRGIVHRDLKPENVMVTAGGSVKIADFGLARALQEGGALTTTSTAVGTPAYMAPELAIGREVGPRADLYAVGVIAYELLSGRLPFENEGMPLATVLQHLRKPVPPLRSVAPEVDPKLAGWVERMLAKDPGKRPAGAAPAWEELEEIVIGILGPRWRRDSRLPGDTPEPVGRAAAAPAGAGKRRWALAAAALVCAGAVGAAVVLITGGTAKKDAMPPQSDRATLALSGPNLLLTDAGGQTVKFSARSLRRLGVVSGPAAGARFSAGGEDEPVFVIRDKAGSVQLCELGPVHPCFPLGFRPTGLGVSPTGLVFTADRLGYVEVFQASAGRLIDSGPISVGADPHGTLVASRGRLYVPIKRGVAVVDPIGRKLLRVIHLPVTPASIWVSPFSGKMFAALYAIDRIARVDTTLSNGTTDLFAGFSKPVAIWGNESYAYELNAGDGTLCRLDALFADQKLCRAVLPHA
jgi:Protein kinase domain